MSTDIIRFQKTDSNSMKPQRVFSFEALQLFLAITLPLMFFTFTIWGLIYWFSTRREKLGLAGGEAGLPHSR
jgi:hypothetical protein